VGAAAELHVRSCAPSQLIDGQHPPARPQVLSELIDEQPGLRLLYTTPESLCRQPTLREYLKARRVGVAAGQHPCQCCPLVLQNDAVTSTPRPHRAMGTVACKRMTASPASTSPAGVAPEGLAAAPPPTQHSCALRRCPQEAHGMGNLLSFAIDEAVSVPALAKITQQSHGHCPRLSPTLLSPTLLPPPCCRQPSGLLVGGR